MYIENTDSISYDIFLKVDTEDFRRSSERPILKTIPPKSKQRVLTMVILKGKEGKYTYTLVINEVAYALQFDKDFECLAIFFPQFLWYHIKVPSFAIIKIPFG